MTTYRSAGVDVGAGERLVASIAEIVQATWGDSVAGPFGSFAAGVRLPSGIDNPILMLTTDGVGTKLDLARRVGILDGLGFDLVAMCVDDLAAVGALPVAFCDYLAVGRLQPDRDQLLVRSIAEACKAAGCPLVGGETAEHPGVLDSNQFDLAGAALGVVAEDRRVTGSAIRPGDVIVGLRSPNLRSNGFSLVRAITSELDLEAPLPGTQRPATETLCEPSVIYAPALTRLVESVPVHGLAHITGGGLVRGLRRVLPEGCRAVVDPRSWEIPAVFESLQRLGSIADNEMRQTFNMGIGFCVVVPTDQVQDTLAATEQHRPAVIGQIYSGPASVDFS